MGNYKFRLSDMIPNAWFHKMKDMSTKPRSNFPKTLNPPNTITTTTTTTTTYKNNPSSSSSSLPSPSQFKNQPHHSLQRKSYYFTRDHTLHNSPIKPSLSAPQPPRKSSRRRRSTRRTQPPPTHLACSCRATADSVSPPSPEECDDHTSSSEPDSVLTEYGSDRGWSSPCKCRTNKSKDIIIDLSCDDDRHRRLAPIITKPPQPETKIQRSAAEFSETNAYGSSTVSVKVDYGGTRRVPGVRLRVNSPRIGSVRRRRSVQRSMAVVKASKDPGRDFRESMVEMIVENDIRRTSELEELLACYLSLNSDEYHDLIINVFKQIWFDFIHLPLLR